MPTFTIITATYNAAQTLPRLLDSLAAQTCRDFSVMLQDGGSSDETVAIAESYRSRLPLLSIESTSDKGIYDAWNKALDRAGDALGDWVLFLGADDILFSDNTLLQVAEKIVDIPKGTFFLAGDLQLVNPIDFSIKRTIKINSKWAFIRRFQGTPLPHTALFHNKIIFIKNRFNDNYKIASDYEFIVKTWRKKNECSFLKIFISYMSDGGISSGDKTNLLLSKEGQQIRKIYFPFMGIIIPFLLNIYTITNKYIKNNLFKKQ